MAFNKDMLDRVLEMTRDELISEIKEKMGPLAFVEAGSDYLPPENLSFLDGAFGDADTGLIRRFLVLNLMNIALGEDGFILGIPSRFLMSEEELAEYHQNNGWYRNEGAAA